MHKRNFTDTTHVCPQNTAFQEFGVGAHKIVRLGNKWMHGIQINQVGYYTSNLESIFLPDEVVPFRYCDLRKDVLPRTFCFNPKDEKVRQATVREVDADEIKIEVDGLGKYKMSRNDISNIHKPEVWNMLGNLAFPLEVVPDMNFWSNGALGEYLAQNLKTEDIPLSTASLKSKSHSDTLVCLRNLQNGQEHTVSMEFFLRTYCPLGFTFSSKLCRPLWIPY